MPLFKSSEEEDRFSALLSSDSTILISVEQEIHYLGVWITFWFAKVSQLLFLRFLLLFLIFSVLFFSLFKSLL